MNFTPERDPRIRALASQAAREIKSLTDAHKQQIEGIYRRFLDQSAAIKEENQCSLTQPTITEGQDDEASTADMDSPGADLLPTTAVNERKEQKPSCHNNPN
ncbi:MAG TPA: hypothetical protein V6D18_04540 [Thermosynechococcaceae cyanobacterium]|jgi:hypothetical protein